MFFDKDLRYWQALYGSYYCLCINLSSMSIFLTCTSTCTDDDNGIGDSVESNLDHIKHHPRLWVCLQELLSSPDYSTRLRSLFSTEAYFSMCCSVFGPRSDNLCVPCHGQLALAGNSKVQNQKFQGPLLTNSGTPNGLRWWPQVVLREAIKKKYI